MTDVQPGPGYRSAETQRMVWWIALSIFYPFASFNDDVKAGSITRRTFSEDVLRRGLGARPNHDDREAMLQGMASAPPIVAFICGVVGLIMGLSVAARWSDLAGGLSMLILYGVTALPILGMGFIWAVRWQIDRISWSRLQKGKSAVYPVASSQPRNSDVVLGALMGMLVAVGFWVNL